jgi:hypothetical protein
VFWNTFAQFVSYPLSDELKELLQGMLTVNPVERWTLEQIKNSMWMQGETPTLEDVQP